MSTLNARGYRSKAYTSRRAKRHPGTPFTVSSVQYMLKNRAYIGKKEINRRAGSGECRLVDAVWRGIVDEEKFLAVQRLMAANGRTNHNGAKTVHHAHVLSGGLLYCGRCDSVMEGRSGTGRLGSRYYYYVCHNRECGLRTLDEVRAEADGMLAGWADLEQESGRAFLTEKLGELAERRSELKRGLAETNAALARIAGEQVTVDTVRASLARFKDVYAQLTPFERKELMRLLLRRAEVDDRQIVLEIYPVTAPEMAVPQSPSRSEAPNWLPGQDSNLQPSG